MEKQKEEMNIYESLSNIQNELKAPKGQRNNFGNYNYRSCEDILEAVKPICKKYNTTLVLSDEIIVIGDNNPTTLNVSTYNKNGEEIRSDDMIVSTQRYYIKATATLFNFKGENISNTANAREEETKKGMDGSQITGTSSSYARKYALNGLFNIDDTKDADSDEYHKQTNKEETKQVKQNNKQDPKKEITKEQAEKHILSFGKHKGKTLKEILKEDVSYIDWLYTSDKTDNEIKSYVELIYSINEPFADMPIGQTQIDYIKELDKEIIKKYLIKIKKSKISEMNYKEANDLLNENKEEESVF